MKEINPTILLAIAGMVIIVAIVAHYSGMTVAATECTQYFSSDDGNGDPMSLKTRFDFYEKSGDQWISGGSYTILANSPLGMSLHLRSDTQYKAVPVSYNVDGWATSDDWIIPPEEIFYGCNKDRLFVWEEIVCTPRTAECEGDVLYTCNSDGTKLTPTTCAYGCSDGACNDPPSVPCAGLSPCTSDLSIFHECCEDDVWSCMWSNYDGEGFRVQWTLWDECDADCTCDGATTEQECWCADLTPDCTGLGVCDHGVFFCDDCCGGNVWKCRGHYKWTMEESCTADETCDCSGDSECLDCDCVATATPTPTPTPSPANIDDSTDTLTFDKSSYQIGDTAYMYATGTNIGGETWSGKVTFTITQPNGIVYETIEQQDVSVTTGSSETVTDSFSLPSTSQPGTWTAQSMWITDDGVIDAMSSILDLGEDESEDYSMWIIGGIAVFLLLLYFAYRKKPTKR